MSSLQTLRLVPIYCGQPARVMEQLAHRIAVHFPLRVELHKPGFDPEIAFDRTRQQYNSRLFLAQLLRHAPADTARILGVTGLDLFIPVLSFVFGEAQLDGRGAVVSTYRLDNQLYGLPEDPGLLFERMCKESVHELGHTFNLAHCHDSQCVMASSTTVDGIDVKSEQFCAPCGERLSRHELIGSRG